MGRVFHGVWKKGYCAEWKFEIEFVLDSER
jgi:hypothetical protein